MKKNSNRFSPLYKVITLLGFAGLLIYIIAIWCHEYRFSENVEKPLRRAAYAKDINDCQRNIGIAVSYLSGYGLKKTQEHFAANQNKPSFQIWFNNLVEIQEALVKAHLNENKGNEQLLISLIRDRLMAERKGNLVLNLPPDHKTYPHTRIFGWWFWISTIFFSGAFPCWKFYS